MLTDLSEFFFLKAPENDDRNNATVSKWDKFAVNDRIIVCGTFKFVKWKVSKIPIGNSSECKWFFNV